MEVNFSEKSVLVTGAGGSIGRVLVNSLMKNGATVYAVDSSDKSLKNLEAEIGGNGKLQTILSDLQGDAVCENVVVDIPKLHGLVHLAGIFEPDEMIVGDTEAVFDPTIEANLRNIYSLFIACKPLLLRSDCSRVILTSSIAFNRGAYLHTAYSAAKGGVVGFMRSLARREAPKILVNAVAPGIIDSPMPADMIAKRGIENVLAQIPLGRLGRASEISGVIEFLLGPSASYVTGQVINADGGLSNN